MIRPKESNLAGTSPGQSSKVIYRLQHTSAQNCIYLQKSEGQFWGTVQAENYCALITAGKKHCNTYAMWSRQDHIHVFSMNWKVVTLRERKNSLRNSPGSRFPPKNNLITGCEVPVFD